MFTDQDLNQIREHGLQLSDVEYQIEKFKKGFPPTVLEAPALEGKGMLKLSDDEVEALEKSYLDNLGSFKIVKFVPASGAATRMFKSLYAFLDAFTGSDEDYEQIKSDQSQGSIFNFFKSIEHFAFYEDLKEKFQELHGKALEEAHIKKEYGKIIEVLLGEDGLNYGNPPKGLLRFHRYEEGARTPVEEHMVEGAQYAKDAEGNVKIHFTVSPDHQSKFEEHVEKIKSGYERKFGVKISVSYSIQKPSTDTIAVDMDNEPFRNDDGSILFRPAGHGALLENLNEIDADIVFLKNIDNVVPDHLKEQTIRYKKVIAGLLLDYHQKISQALTKLEENDGIEQAKRLLEDHLGYQLSESFGDLSEADQIKTLQQKLHRPLRVCGMVKSDGDPGGGPFWVKAKDGSASLQVVETAQIDLDGKGQKEAFNSATHFNPVDVVCMLKDYKGQAFDLLKHRDPDTGFITKKSKDGKDLKAQELPGLWNGAMADWNTVFVEVPAVTFNPVKSVNDLLQPAHQPKD